MSAPGWLRAQAGVLALFAAGHTLGTAAPRVTRGAAESALFRAMQSYRFPVMGFDRSYWDFYRGFAITISVLMLVMAVVAWQAGAVAARSPRQALPLAVTLLLGCAGLVAVSLRFFFAAPVLFSAAAALCALVAAALLAREAARAPA